MESVIIKAVAPVDVDLADARRWFLELERHPERYQFETHAGFEFTAGSFGEAGARFQTWEHFYGLKLTLSFELEEVGKTHFRFRLIRPPLPVWGVFVLERASSDVTFLRLEIGETTSLGRWLLRLPLVRGAIQRQIQGEVDHIKESMETVFSSGS
ncbi:MAG: hypothetical protein PVI59_00340 [Anaerolineae bacterium]|jgi:hypothetical protein